MRVLLSVALAVGCLCGDARADAPPSDPYHHGIAMRAIGEFDQAASAFERFATESPQAAEAPTALSDAIVLRFGLNDDVHARDDAERFRRTYGATQPDMAAKISYAIAAYESERGDWLAVERDLTAQMASIDRGPTYLRMSAHALLGKTFARHAGDARAAAEYTRVRELGASLKPGPSEADLRPYAKGLLALGEATIFDADAHRAAATWTHLAAYSGRADASQVDAWIAAKVTPWVQARSATIAGLAHEYEKVLAIGEYPPPSAVVDAASRVAMMWAGAVDELALLLPSPRWDAVARKRFLEAMAKAAAPLAAKAKPAVLACVTFSVKFQWTDDASAACGAWLTKTYRSESPPLDELLLPRTFRFTSGATEEAPLRGR